MPHGHQLGAALRLLLECLRRDVAKTTPTTKGDYRPLVFLFTDGQPTDDYQPAAKAVRAANNPRIANIYAIACGPDVDTDVLREVTDIVLQMPATSEAFRQFFVWLSTSVQSASTVLDRNLWTASRTAVTPFQPGDGPREVGFRSQLRIRVRCSCTLVAIKTASPISCALRGGLMTGALRGHCRAPPRNHRKGRQRPAATDQLQPTRRLSSRSRP